MSELPELPIGYVRAAVATARGARLDNEDAVGLAGWVAYGDSGVVAEQGSQAAIKPLEVLLPVERSGALLVALADGMGGVPRGGRAARIAAEALTARTGWLNEPEARSAFATAHARVLAASDERSVGMGCTAALVGLHYDGTVVVANVGDVRVYRVVEGYAGQLTRDDRLVETTEKGSDAVAIEATSALVTRSVGGQRLTPADPHTHRISVQPRDRLLLCSDGIYDAVDPTDPEAGLLDPHPTGAAESILRRALAAPGYQGDNATVVVLDIRAVRSV